MLGKNLVNLGSNRQKSCWHLEPTGYIVQQVHTVGIFQIGMKMIFMVSSSLLWMNTKTVRIDIRVKNSLTGEMAHYQRGLHESLVQGIG